MTVRITQLHIHARYKIGTRLSLFLSSVSHRRSLVNHFCPLVAVDIRGTLTKWRRKVGRMRQGVRLTRRRCAEKKDGSRSGTKWSIHFFQLSRHIADNWGTEEGDEEDWRETQRHPSPPRQNRVAWMVLKPAPVHQTCGNCVSIKRFPDTVHVELSGESSWWLWTHSISIERLLRGY